DIGSYMLCVCAFMAAPLITRHRQHIAVTVVLELLPASARQKANRILDMVTAAVLLIVAYFVIDLCLRQYHQGVLAPMANQIPRWGLPAVRAFGIILAALNFIAPADRVADEIVEI